MKILDGVAVILVLIAALNCGLMGIFDLDLIRFLFNSPTTERVIYALFGIAAIYVIVYSKGLKICGCSSKGSK